ncbi:MAG: hypothetical protein PHH75_00265 [Candidatus Omnitrophica bacterium]|nr:hypothetical protein [Candidatus Omnitrophota bacterium]MDD5573599.1 hypothetical protein [Candidatus Omnitrophota bacterium]
MKKTRALTWLAIVVGFVGLAGGLVVASSDWPDLAPEPQLLEPAGEVVDLTGKQTLTFKWSPFVGRMWERQYYDFRLYKGRDRVEDAQMIVKQVPKDQYSVVIDAKVFEDGQAYTWGLKQVYMDRKSEQAYSSFKVKKSGVSGCPI